MLKNFTIFAVVLLLLLGLYLLFNQLKPNKTGSDIFPGNSNEEIVVDDSGFPQYPTAEAVGPVEAGGEKQAWRTQDAVLQVTAWYMGNLTDYGYNIETTIDVLKEDVQEVEISKDNERFLLTIISTDGTTEIRLTPVQ